MDEITVSVRDYVGIYSCRGDSFLIDEETAEKIDRSGISRKGPRTAQTPRWRPSSAAGSPGGM